MRVLQEVTDWSTPNHVYFTNQSKDKIYAYVKASNGQLEVLAKPLKFSTSGRKFKEVENQWGYSIPDTKPEGFVKEVTGSKGDRYIITELDGVRQCSCSGFKFRSTCRHTAD